ncbi:MAG: flotillin family protein, partial [Parachlamydiaceae bacterium]
ANFVSGLMQSVPPLNDLFNMAGMNLPSFLKGEAEKDNNIPIPLVDNKKEDDNKAK